MRFLKAGLAALVLATLLAGPPWLLAHFIGNPWPPGGVSLSSPLTDEAIVGLLAAIVWLLWAQFAVCVLVETAAALTDDRVSLSAPATFSVQRQLARRLVATVVIATVSTPLLGSGAAAAAVEMGGHLDPVRVERLSTPGDGPVHDRAVAAQHTDIRRTDWSPTLGQVQPEGDQPDVAELPPPTDHPPGRSSPTVTVMRLDTLWSIAERVLGSGERWPEIATLNEGRIMPDGVPFVSADHIRPGWQLIVPARTPAGHIATSDPASTAMDTQVEGDHHRGTAADTPGDGSTAVTVHRGDSLWSIAHDRLGDGQAWPRLYRISQSEIGTNPDLIYPGQVITLPAKHQPAAPASTRPEETTPPDHSPAFPEPPAGDISQTPPVRPDRPEPRSDTGAPGDQDADDAGNAEPTSQPDLTAMRALLATAALLSAGIGATLIANRRNQFRERRPGRAVAEPGPALASLERIVHESIAVTRTTSEFVDLALRHLAAGQRARHEPLPDLDMALLDDSGITLVFDPPPQGTPPPGWVATTTGWTLDRGTALSSTLHAQPAPYPALASVGTDEDGRTWMLDLEQHGTITITGQEPSEVQRFLAAELAMNPWTAEGSVVLLVGGALPEVRDFAPTRVRAVSEGDAQRRVTGFLAAHPDDETPNLLTRRRDDHAVDSTAPLIVVTPAEHSQMRDLLPSRRSGLIVLRTEGEPTLEIVDHDRVRLLTHGVELTPFRLGHDQALDMAALMVATGITTDAAMPAASGDTDLGQLTNVDGSVRTSLTVSRDLDPSGRTTLLPGSDADYATTTATLPADISILAPSVPDPIREDLLRADPNLEQDLHDWFDDQSPRPRVRVLGPVDVSAVTGERDTVANIGGTVEFVVYLACRDRGVTKDRAAEDLGWSGATVQNRARDARRILGSRPDGGEWLPDAARSDSARRRGVATYQLHPDVLIDADLFRRLRTRAAARGADGLEDLVLALTLVSGEPFEQLRRGGYGWLLEGDRLDHHLCAAIADVAHMVADRSLLDNDLHMARRASQIGIRVNPYSDVARLDLAAVIDAEGGDPDKVVKRDIVDRVDADLTPRTEQVLRNRGWLTG